MFKKFVHPYLFWTFFLFVTVHFKLFEPSTFSVLDPSSWVFWTLHFQCFGPSTLSLLDRPLSSLTTVQFPSLRPLSSLFSDRPFSQTVHFEPFGPFTILPHDRPVSFLQTAQFFNFGPSIFADRPLLAFLDRSLWPMTVHFRPDPENIFSQNGVTDVFEIR